MGYLLLVYLLLHQSHFSSLYYRSEHNLFKILHCSVVKQQVIKKLINNLNTQILGIYQNIIFTLLYTVMYDNKHNNIFVTL